MPKSRVAAVCTVVLLTGSSVFAAQRTFVSTSGIDTNPCSLAQPCRNFGAAIAQTAAGGEVYVLDSGGYGMAIIGSSITIRAEGVSAGVSVFPTGTMIGILVNAGPSDVVTLHGLSINGVGGSSGIAFGGGAALHVEQVVVSNFYSAIDVTAAADTFLTDVNVRDNTIGQAGVWVHPSGGTAAVSIDRARFEHNSRGLLVYDGGRVIARDSSATGNTSGFGVAAIAAVAELTLENCVAAGNGVGVESDAPTTGVPATVRISNVTVTGNGQGLLVTGHGAIVSFGNNRVLGNTTDGAPTATVPRM